MQFPSESKVRATGFACGAASARGRLSLPGPFAGAVGGMPADAFIEEDEPIAAVPSNSEGTVLVDVTILRAGNSNSTFQKAWSLMDLASTESQG